MTAAVPSFAGLAQLRRRVMAAAAWADEAHPHRTELLEAAVELQRARRAHGVRRAHLAARAIAVLDAAGFR